MRWLTTLTAEVIEGLPDPDAARFHLALRELRIQGGQAIPLPSVGVTAIVGANNVGKSSVLAQLDFALRREAHQSDPVPKIVTSVGIDSSAEVQDLLLWLGQNVEYHDSQGDPGFATPEGSTVHPAVIVNSWPSAEHSVSSGRLESCWSTSTNPSREWKRRSLRSESMTSTSRHCRCFNESRTRRTQWRRCPGCQSRPWRAYHCRQLANGVDPACGHTDGRGPSR